MWRTHAPCSTKDLHHNNICFEITNLLNTSFNLFIDDVLMRKLILVLRWTNHLIVFLKCCFYELKKMQVFRNENLFITQSFIVMYILSGNYSIVCIGVSSLPLKNITLSFLPSPPCPLQSANCLSPPPFKVIPSLYIDFL